VKIDTYKTNFWRYQSVGDECLATIEAIYYFLREFTVSWCLFLSILVYSTARVDDEQTTQAKKNEGKYEGEMDDMLYYYTYLYKVIQRAYKTDKTRHFAHIEGYIKY